MAGLSAITSNGGSLPEVAADVALLVNPNSTDTIAAAMILLLCDPAKGRMMQLEGPRRAATYTWSRTAAETWKCYIKLYSRRDRKRAS